MTTVQSADKAKQISDCDTTQRPISDHLKRALTMCPQHTSQNFVKINLLIDLTDKPIKLTRDEICWSRVRTNASNCICCCCNSSITLVTTDESYVLDHIPLDNIKTGQANSGLQFLAVANDDQLSIIDLIESNACQSPVTSKSLNNSRQQHQPNRGLKSNRKLVDLASIGLSMRDILFWRWIDENTLALVSNEALYTCQVDRAHISHPALTALSQSPVQLLPLQRVCYIHPDLGVLSQITDVHMDASTNLYAITGLYEPGSTASACHNVSQLQYINKLQQDTCGDKSHQVASSNTRSVHDCMSMRLKPNSNSVPGCLSLLENVEEQGILSGDIMAKNFYFKESMRRSSKISRSVSAKKGSNSGTTITGRVSNEVIRGKTQIYCKIRECSQLIQAHAVAFTTTTTTNHQTADHSRPSGLSNESVTRTTLVAANRVNDKIKIYFIGMATTGDLSTSGQNISRSLEFNSFHDGRMDFPTTIVCCKLNPDNERAQAAMVITKFGHLIVCSLAQGSILFNVQISQDIISGAVLEDKSKGLMVICRNGQVLLIRIQEDTFLHLLDETKMMRRSVSSYYIPGSHMNDTDFESSTTVDLACRSSVIIDQQVTSSETESIDIEIEVLMSTKL